MVKFEVESRDGRARGSILTTPHTVLQTPVFLLHTNNGNPAYLTPDILAGLKDAKALHLTLQDMLEVKEVLHKYGKGAHSFFHLNEHSLFLSLRDPKAFVDCPGANDDSINIMAKKGNTKTSQKKARKSVDLALKWLDAVLSNLSPTLKDSVFGVIEGSGILELRKRSATETASRPVAGFIIGGLDTGEALQERNTIVDAVVDILPPDKPRMVIGPTSPEDILDLVERGVDIFCGVYPHLLTEHGFALTFPLNSAQKPHPRKLNLRDPKYIIDPQPLLEGCECYSCKNHTKAYVHHLLNVHEMLAEVLLEIKDIQKIRRMADTTLTEGDAETQVGQTMDVFTALKEVLKRALIHGGLYRGIRECVRELDRKTALLCVLVDTVDEPAYKRLVEALCAEHNINLIKVPDAKQLGVWVGLCKLDKEAKPRSIIATSCAVVTNYGEESEALTVLLDFFKKRGAE